MALSNPKNAANRKVGVVMKRPSFRKRKFRTAGARMRAAWKIAQQEGWRGKSKAKSKAKASKKKAKKSARRGGKLNAYARFLKSIGGKGYSRSRIKRMWAAKKKGSKIPAASRRRKTTRKSSRKGKLNAYAKFLKSIGGKGYSKSQIKRLWAAKKRGVTVKDVTPRRSTSRSTSRASGRRITAKKPTNVQSFFRDTGLGRGTYASAQQIAARKKKSYEAAKKRLLAAKKAGTVDMTYGEIHQAARQAARMNGSSALLNGLALQNGLALDNPSLLSFSGLWEVITTDMTPVLIGASIGGATHAFASSMGVTSKLVDTIDGLPFVGPLLGETQLPFFDQSVTELLPYTIQGSAVFLLAGVAAGFAPPGIVRNILASVAGSSLAFGGGLDAFNFVTAKRAQTSVDGELLAALEAEGADLSGLALSGLALDNGLGGLALQNGLGGLALDNVSTFGGLALDNGYGNFGDLGDGFAYQTAPLQASDVGDYGQACMADAYYSGADFSSEEGQALLNGRQAFQNCFGAAPYRPKGDPSNASHLAGRRGHRWGWLISAVGWDKARQIAALPPQKRLAVIQSMRQGAMKAYQQEMLRAQALKVEAQAPAPEFGPAGASGPTGAFGDPALFMS